MPPTLDELQHQLRQRTTELDQARRTISDQERQLAVERTGSRLHIFEEFRQVERQEGPEVEGSGLGLAIAKKSMELLGGTITCHSEEGTGTTFTMRIGDWVN